MLSKFVLTASTVGLLAGCGHAKDSGEPASSATPSPEAPTVSAETPTQPSDEGTTNENSVLIPAGGQVTDTGKATFSLGKVQDAMVSDGLHHQVIETLEGTAEVLLRFDATVQNNGLQFEFAYDGGDAEFAMVDRGFMTVVEEGESFVATQGSARISVVDDQHLRVEFTDVAIGKLVPTTGLFERVHDIGDGFVEGVVERSCRYLATDTDEGNVHNSDGTPNVMLRDDETWSSEFCAPYANLAD
jgi:hypothetical protein